MTARSADMALTASLLPLCSGGSDCCRNKLGLVARTRRVLKFPLPLAELAHSMFVNANNAGLGKNDDSAVVRNFAGTKRPKDRS